MPREDRLKGTPFENLSHGETASFGGPDHDGLTGEKKEGIFVPRETVQRWKNRVDQLNFLAEKLMIALGDSTTMDTLTGNPGVLVDRIIAERDGFKLQATANVDYIKALLSERDDLKTTLRAATEELVRLNDELTEAHAEVKRLRGQLPPPPVHEVEIMHERTHGDGAEVRIKCPYPGCNFDVTLAGPVAGDVHDMVPALAEAHRTDMEVEPDAEG